MEYMNPSTTTRRSESQNSLRIESFAFAIIDTQLPLFEGWQGSWKEVSVQQGLADGT